MSEVLTLTAARASLATLRSQHTAGVARRDLLISQRDSKSLDLDAATRNIATWQLVRALLNKVSDYARQQLKARIEETVTAALQAVFADDSVRFEISLREVGGKPAAEWVVISRYGTQELQTSPEDGDGGGICDVISLALRLALLELARPKIGGPLVFDEPAKMVSAEYAPNLAEFLKSYARRTGRQIVMVTHNDTLAAAADKSYRASKNAQGICEVAAI
jgi:DNA repair exonuclease SbcCD ATPase subunit